MRGFVEHYEAIAQELPVGVEPSHDDFVAYWNNRLDAIIANAKANSPK
jgi:hypothetical protein